MQKLALIIPVYNEEAAIGAVLQKWYNELKRLGIEFEIHAYNDGSRDHSSEVLHKCATQLGHEIVVHDKANSGHGPTILQGYRENAYTADWLFQVDSDDEMGPEQFGELWNRRNEFDFLLGQRDGRKQPLPRKIISFVSRLSVHLFYGKSVWDVNAPYRLMRATAFREIYEQIPNNTFAPNVILSGMVARNQLRYTELPVPQKDRQTGEVSIKKWKLAKAAFRSFGQTILFALTNGHSSPAPRGFLEKLAEYSGTHSLLFILLFTLSFCTLNSTLSPLSPVQPTGDSSVFLYIGTQMHQGAVPYADMFDHKGMLIYFINYLGTFAHSYFGLFLMEWLCLFLCLYFMFKTAFLICESKLGALTLSTFASLLLSNVIGNGCFAEGNRVEEYALPFIALLVYLLTQAAVKSNFVLGKGASFLLGCGVGAIVLLRPNMGGSWLIILPFLLFLYLYRAAYKQAFLFFLFTTLGVFCFLTPFITYLALNNALKDCYEQYVLFNSLYLKTYSDAAPTIFSGRIRLLMNPQTFLLVGAILCACLAFLSGKQNRKLSLLFWVGLLAHISSYILGTISGRGFVYYAMILPPTLCIPYAASLKMIAPTPAKNRHLNKPLFLILIGILLLDFAPTLYSSVLSPNQSSRDKSANIQKLCAAIHEETRPDQKIIALDFAPWCYLFSGRTAASRYFYQRPPAWVDPNNIVIQFEEELTNNPPALVLVCNTMWKDEKQPFHFLPDFLKQNYTLNKEEAGFQIWKKTPASP